MPNLPPPHNKELKYMQQLEEFGIIFIMILWNLTKELLVNRNIRTNIVLQHNSSFVISNEIFSKADILQIDEFSFVV